MKRIVQTVAALALLLMCATSARAQGAGTFFLKSAPGTNAQATATQTAAGAGVRNVADCVTATFVATGTAPAAVTVAVLIRDGATGVGTVLATWAMSLPATAGASNAPIQLCGVGVTGSANTAMTIEFSAAGGAQTVETVTLKGHRERF